MRLKLDNVFSYPFGMLMPERSFSSGDYRYGFNSQEKDDEVAGSGNVNTAEFWEYDCRLGRRWNVDPKSNESISGFSCFNNNPVWFCDPNGDTIKMKYGGFLFLFRKTGTYSNGKFYDNKGKEIDSKNKFFNSVNNALKDLNSKSFGKELLQDLSESTKTIWIKRKPGGAVGSEFEPKSIKKAQTPGVGSGGTLHVGIGTIKGEFLYVFLAHEMGHAISSISGHSGTGVWFKTKSGEKTSNEEKNGMRAENRVLAEHNLPLRDFYDEERQLGPRSDLE